MPKFFREGFSADSPVIYGPDADHIIRALRMKPGEALTVGDLNGTAYVCRILSVADKEVTLEIVSQSKEASEPDIDVTLFMCLPKGDKLETVIQKSVELGVSRVVPVLSSRCISRPDARSMEKKLVRLNSIASQAAVQSARGIIPEVSPCLSFDRAVSLIPDFDSALFFYEGGGAPVGELVHGKRIAVFVGPEGGFDAAETAQAVAAGAFAATLGPRILRTETAPVAALAVIMYLTGNMK